MSIIKQNIKNGFNSQKVTSGDPKNMSNRASNNDQNSQTKPFRPK